MKQECSSIVKLISKLQTTEFSHPPYTAIFHPKSRKYIKETGNNLARSVLILGNGSVCQIDRYIKKRTKIIDVKHYRCCRITLPYPSNNSVEYLLCAVERLSVLYDLVTYSSCHCRRCSCFITSSNMDGRQEAWCCTRKKRFTLDCLISVSPSFKRIILETSPHL